MTRLDQSRASEIIWWIISTNIFLSNEMGQQINPTHKENDSHSPGFWRRAFLSSRRSVIGCELYLGRFAVSVNCVPVKSIVKLGNASDIRNKSVAMMTVHTMSQWAVHLFAVRMLGVLIYASVELGFRFVSKSPIVFLLTLLYHCWLASGNPAYRYATALPPRSAVKTREEGRAGTEVVQRCATAVRGPRSAVVR